MNRMVIGAALLMLASCATTQRANVSSVKESGFLRDYSQLTPTSQSDQAVLRYVNPAANWSSYHAVRLEPVTYWAGADSTVPESVESTLCDYAYAKVREALLAKGATIVEQGGPGVITIRMALTEATSTTPGLRTISVVVPQARLLAAAGNLATGKQAFAGGIQSEGELIDSVTGKRLAAWVDKRSGSASIQNAVNGTWGDAEKAIDFWAATLAERYAQVRGGRAL